MNTIAIGFAFNHKRVIVVLRWPKTRTILDRAARKLRGLLDGMYIPMASYGIA